MSLESRRRRSKRRRAKRRLRHESLEDRRLLATITVTSLRDVTANDGEVTLREAIQAANTNLSVDGSNAGEAGPVMDVIQFEPGLTGAIVLGGERLEITEDLTINGPGANLLEIDANGGSQVLFTSGTDTDVTLDSLTLRQGLGTNGGAIENFNATVTVSNSTISGSLSRSFGAGILNSSAGTMTIVDSVITNNFSVSQTYTSGGGVANFGKLTISRSSISGNTAQAGGGVLNFQGDATITDSTISGNTAFTGGGGISNVFGKVLLNNSTVSGNNATVGGGIYNQGSPSVTVVGSTIVANRADPNGFGTGTGGGLFTDGSGSAGFTNLFNTIVAGNLVGSGNTANDIDGKNVEAVSANNLIGDPASAGGLAEGVLGNRLGNGSGELLALADIINPALGNNGGPTQTHALNDTGRAVNGGNNTFATTGGLDGVPGTGDAGEVALAQDQRGAPFTRIVNGTVDIGAIESPSGLVAELELELAVNNANPIQGDDLEFTITITNNGPSDASSVVARNPVPNGLFFFAADTPNFNLSTGIWTVGSIASGDAAVLNFTARVESADPIVNIARIESTDQADDNPNNNRATLLIDATPPNLIFDFGDAPTSAQSGRAQDYPVTVAQNGARHIVGDLFMGSLIDAEADGMPDNAAGQDGTGGDDNNERADEDGIALTATLIASNNGPTTASLFVFSSGPGVVDGWLDLNQDGDWSDPGEQIISGAIVAAGRNLVSYSVLNGAAPGPTFARFRLSSSGGLSPTGAAPNGEVEDKLMLLLDGDTRPDANVGLPNGSADIEVDGGRVIVREGPTSLFAAPTSSVGEVEVRSGTGDDTVTLDFANGSGSQLRLKGSEGQNQLVISSGLVDLSAVGNVIAENFGSIDATDARPSRITVDAAAVATLAPATKLLSVVGAASDFLVFQDADDWRLTSTKTVGIDFIRVMTNQVSGEVVELNSPTAWRNPVEPSDVNNDGDVSASDALRIINELSNRDFSDATSEDLDDPLSLSPWPGIYFDQSGDGKATALDALRVINRLQEIVESGGEGERPSVGLQNFSPTTSMKFDSTIPSPSDDEIGPAEAGKVAAFSSPATTATEGTPKQTIELRANADAKWAARVDQLLNDLGGESSDLDADGVFDQ